MGSGKNQEFPLSVSVSDGVFIRSFARGHCLDIGTGLGLSAWYLAEATGMVLSLEQDSTSYVHKELAHPKVSYVTGTQWWELRPDYLKTFDTVFIDHFPVGDRLDAFQFFQKTGARVMLHDYDLPLVRKHLDTTGCEVLAQAGTDDHIGGILYWPGNLDNF